MRQPGAQRVLVDATGRRHPAFQFAEYRHEKVGLAEHAFGAAIRVRRRLQAAGHQPLEILDRFPTAAEVVVEREDLDDQPGTQPERRRYAGLAGEAGGATDEDLALEFREEWRRACQV